MNQILNTGWWSFLAKKDMLALAILLSKNALPVWDNYQFACVTVEGLKPLPAQALIVIEKVKPEQKNKEIENAIKKYFTLFISPFIQLQDGDLELPYEVKSSFLSVFYILKGLLSTRNKAITESFSTSVSKSLDAIYISKKMTNQQIETLLQKFIHLSKKNQEQ